MNEAPKRCAIYTRKSFSPPAGQEVTSLESQRRICSAYIMSQQHRSWTEIARTYDDAGRTGADTSRPALQQLLKDIEGGLVDVVLVYKLDRLTRTLIDFVRMMDFFERHGVAIVSITQNFDTADSLGRLILNVLLTFAQFEREILSDRMRDKIKVLKQLGRWVGGSPPLGYDVVKAKLIPNQSEAAGVALIFRSYLQTASVEAVHRLLNETGFRRKVWKARTGRVYGGGPITISSLHHILHNPIYVGQIRHRGECYEGLHQPIVDPATWKAVQSLLAENSARRPRLAENLLTGLLFDRAGRPMCAKTTEYKGRTLRYYVSNVSAWARRQQLRRTRANGDELERLVLASLATMLRDPQQLRGMLLDHGFHGSALDSATRSGSAGAARLRSLPKTRLNGVLKALIERVELSRDHLKLVLSPQDVMTFLAWDGVGNFQADMDARGRRADRYVMEVPATLIREQKVHALPIGPAGGSSVAPVPKLIALLDEGRRANELMHDRRDLGIGELSRMSGCKMARFSRLVRLNYLAPDILLAIRDGTQPAGLTRTTLMKTEIPLDWAIQRSLLGFPQQPEFHRNPDASKAVASVAT